MLDTLNSNKTASTPPATHSLTTYLTPSFQAQYQEHSKEL